MQHMAELTVRETCDFSRRVQGAGSRISKLAPHGMCTAEQMHSQAALYCAMRTSAQACPAAMLESFISMRR